MSSGLRTQILFLALFPPLLVAIALGIYLSFTRIQDLQHFMDERAHALTLQLGINAQHSLTDKNIALLQSLGNASLEESGVRAVGFFDAAGLPLALSGPSLKVQWQARPAATTAPWSYANDNLYGVVRPIYLQAFTSNLDLENPADKLAGWVAVEYNRDNILIRQYRHLFTQALLILLALLTSGGMGIFLAQRLVNDIHALNNTIKRIKEGESGNLPKIHSSAEMISLANNIESMAQKLQHDFDDIRHNLEISANDLKETIETIEIQNIELNLAKKEALTASKVKSEFLANTSHEIRTPLNGIIGFAKILRKTALNNQQKEYVDTIQQSSENLLAIINDVLDFSKIEAGKLELELAPLNIRQVLEECITLFAPHAYEKNVEMVLIIYQDVPANIIGDPLRIKQVISNLLSNAVKFTHEGTIAIRVALEHMDNEHVELDISVSDTGVGISAEQQKNIFQAFTQANTSISREYGGTGLGLAIVKKLVELMNDDIRVESAVGEGSTFRFVLKTTLPEHQETPSYKHLQNKTILVIESHELLNLSIKHLLQSWGVNVLATGTPEQAAMLLAEHHADILILGLHANSTEGQPAPTMELLGKHSIPMLLLAPANMDKMLQSLPGKNLNISYKPVTEARLYHSLYDILYPQKTLPHTHYLPTEHGTGEFSPRQLRILAVDDQPANLKLLNVLLSDLGMTVTDAHNGQEAIDLCQQQSFDLVFMDIQMPVINGLNATRMIRESGSTNMDIPIIAITAHAMADEKDAITKSGMNDYITKPINEEQLKAIIGKWCPASDDITNVTVDTALCLKLANFKPDLASEMFSMLMQGLPDEMATIRQALQAGDPEALLEQVHKLHGACCYTGVPRLKSVAQKFEYAIKSGDTGKWPSLLAELDEAASSALAWQANNNLGRLLLSVE